MRALAEAVDDLLRHLRGGGELGPGTADALERAAAAAGDAALASALGDLAAALRAPGAGADRELLAARLGRAIASLRARLESEAPLSQGQPRPAVPRRPERAGGARSDPLSLPVRSIRGVGDKVERCFAARGIETVGDLLHLMPRAYEDRRRGGLVAALVPGAPGFVLGAITRASWSGFRATRRFRMEIADREGGAIGCIWFRAHRGMDRFGAGARVRVSGVPRLHRGALEMHHPDVELVGDDDEGGPGENPIVPRYPEIEGIPRRTLWRLVREALAGLGDVPDPLPEAIRARHGLPDLAASLRAVHLPPPESDVEALAALRHPAQRRLVFEELFALQLALARGARERHAHPAVALSACGTLVRALRERLPFPLTAAQERALAEITADLRRPAPMSRLLHGDVGSGKTLVALGAALTAIEDGFQAAVLAPTEVLAEQHFRTLGHLASTLGIGSALLTSSITGARRRAVREEVQGGIAKLVIGTQALLYDAVEFDALALCVVDEQHRFGVLQRAALTAKGPAGVTPHLLVMTATPIPRTLAMTVYGDLAVSVLDEKPPGREAIETRLYTEASRGKVLEGLRRAVLSGVQAYVVAPLVEGSEKLDVRDAQSTWAELSAGPLAGIPVGLLHGRMGADEKREVLRRFQEGALRVLVCTTVVEVGVDVPSATLLVVEHAERFGLAQLHQLRGRVGRGGGKSHCLLLTGPGAGPDACERLRILTATDDGFAIAEEDLRLRGPGEILGTLQAGRPALMLADLARDAALLALAREAAFALVKADPALEVPEHRRSWEMLAARYGPVLSLLRVA